MPPSSSSLQAARQRLGGKLRDLRLAAGLTGRAFAAAAGCQASKVSQIEKGVRPASVGDVRLWCRICGASPQQAEDLLAEQVAVARLWIAFRDLDRRTGLNATQKMLSGDNASECPAVFVIPETGDFVFRGKTITDPALITELNQHIGKAEDESDVWLPARMAPLIRDALDGYEQGRQGPGQHTFAELLAATDTSAIRLEMRDSYDQTEQGFAEWQATGGIGAYDWGDHLDVIRAGKPRSSSSSRPEPRHRSRNRADRRGG